MSSYIVTNKSSSTVVVAGHSLPPTGQVVVGTLTDDISQGQAAGVLTITAVTSPVADASNASITNSVALTVGANPVAAGRMLRVNCTTAGNVVVTLSGGSTETIAVTTGYAMYPFAVTQVVSAGTTAVAAYANLY